MIKWLPIILHTFTSLIRARRDLAFENLLLRQQLGRISHDTLSYPDLHCIWLHISADPSPNIATAMFLNRSTKLFCQRHCKFRILRAICGLAVLKGRGERPRLSSADRSFWVLAFFSRKVSSIGLREVLTAPASPWQNAYAERVIGTIRWACKKPVLAIHNRESDQIGSIL
jgi:hypothetical protein